MASKRTKRGKGRRRSSRRSGGSTFGIGTEIAYNSELSARNSKGWPGAHHVDFGKCVGFPDTLRCTLKYTQDINLSGSSNPAPQVFRANSLFDPDLTGSGHQPSYFDTLDAVYELYCVLGCRARITFKNATTSVGADIVVVFAPQNISSQAVASLAESRYAKLTATAPNNSGPVVQTVEMPYMATSKIAGVDDPVNDPDLRSLTNTNPAYPWFLIIRAEATDGVTSATVFAHVEIWYDSVFINPNESIPSLRKPSVVSDEKDSNEKDFKEFLKWKRQSSAVKA